jgi:hypothetical protein
MLKFEGGSVVRQKGKGSHAKTRRRERLGIAQVSQLPETFCGHEGDLECSGWTELGMGIERAGGKIQSVVKPP